MADADDDCRSLRFSDDSLFLGFDCSTQSLKATVLDAGLAVVAADSVHFDSELPHYGTEGGIRRDPAERGRIVSPPQMWAEALDLLLDRLSPRVDLRRVAAVSGSAQQHGSVYWGKGAGAALATLDPAKNLAPQLAGAFAAPESPVWMDSSTTAQCREVEAAMGGPLRLAALTGCRAHERCTGPQIRRMHQTRPRVYDATERISLVSSFMASLLIGAYACIDETDGAGMNLMDIATRQLREDALEATAPNLEEKIGKLAPAHAVVGKIAPYFVQRFQFASSCVVIQWSGDNPNSLAGLTLNNPGDLAISLGTSDTVFGVTNSPEPTLEGNIFPNPVDPKTYMVLLCYKNGSLTREDIRNRYAERSWDVFNRLLEETAPLNGGKLGFYYKEHEILPPLPVGFHRYIIKNFTGGSLDAMVEHEVDEFDPASEVRAIIEGQFLSMRGHAERCGLPVPPKRIIATGGASSNPLILETMTSIFGCPVYTSQRSDSASLGAALRAAHGWLCNRQGEFVPFSCVYSGRLDTTSLSIKLGVPFGDCKGDTELLNNYTLLVKKRLEIEQRLIERFGRPE
ncbi:xylulose kinase 2-like isoform X1 [Phragmites australis]|uniref:xylulose kinase 2-like isoform X1 n=1 Tax=Phragmites australis TaxID=29695 RepID=UPI002D788D24|nr:xylulose kinase 2-like isoform X1 [Phragmites australis]XP_062204436.1 xylulose kinase 2-like isoform X1 [Phragmites australis]